MDKKKDTSATDPGGKEQDAAPGRKDQDELAWYKKEVRHLRGKIQGYQTLSSLLQDSKQEIKHLKTSNSELLERMGELLSIQKSAAEPSSSLVSLAHIDSVTEEKRVLSGEGSLYPLDRSTGHASVASENNELDSMEVVNADQLSLPETGERLMSQVPQSLEIDPYDLHGAMVAQGAGVVPLNPQNPFSLQHHDDEGTKSPTATSPGNLSDSIVLISPEESAGLQGALVNQVRQISQALTQNVGLNSPSELSDALARLAIDVLKVEKELRLKQGMINDLRPENEQLKNKLEATIRAREESIRHLRKENIELQQRIIEFQKRQSSPKGATSQDWVHVQNPKTADEVAAVNERWEKQTRDLESLHTTEVQQLQVHLEDTRRRLRVAEARPAQCQQEHDKLLHMAKARTEEETKAKEAAIFQFRREQERRHQCETELIAERRRTAVLTDQVAAFEQQLAIFQNSQFTSNNLSPEETVTSLAALSPEDLRTQVQILTQQVSIYKEDFNRERDDRERVQADKDAIQSGLARYKTDIAAAKRKVHELQQERDLLKSENACLRREFQQIRQSDHDVVRLQSENMRLREQLQQKIDEIRRLTTASGVAGVAGRNLDVYPNDRPAVCGDTWRCTACTFDNPIVRSSCEVCGRSRNRTNRSPTPSRQARQLISHTAPPYGWTECDTTSGPVRVTAGDDLIIDQGEDVPDTMKN